MGRKSAFAPLARVKRFLNLANTTVGEWAIAFIVVAIAIVAGLVFVFVWNTNILAKFELFLSCLPVLYFHYLYWTNRRESAYYITLYRRATEGKEEKCWQFHPAFEPAVLLIFLSVHIMLWKTLYCTPLFGIALTLIVDILAFIIAREIQTRTEERSRARSFVGLVGMTLTSFWIAADMLMQATFGRAHRLWEILGSLAITLVVLVFFIWNLRDKPEASAEVDRIMAEKDTKEPGTEDEEEALTTEELERLLAERLKAEKEKKKKEADEEETEESEEEEEDDE